MDRPIQKRMTLEELTDVLIYFSNSLADKTTVDDILWDLAQNCISKLGFVDCIIYLVDEKGEKLIQKAALGPKNPKPYQILNPIEIPLGTGITGFVAQTGQAEIIEDTSKDTRYIIDDEARLSEITVPIKIENRVLGLIDSEHPQAGFFTPQDLQIVSAIASVCAYKLEKVRGEQRIRQEQEHALELQRQMNTWKAQAFRAQMNPHFVFNALNAIQHFITINDKKLAIRYLSLFSKLIRHHLKFYEKDTVLLAEEWKMLDWYLQLQALRYEDQFSYKLHSISPGPLQKTFIPTFVLASLLEYGVERTMQGKEHKGFIEISAHYASNRVQIDLFFASDDFAKPTASTDANYREDLLSMEEHIHFLNEVKDYQIQLETQTRIANESTPKGVRCQLTIPILPS